MVNSLRPNNNIYKLNNKCLTLVIYFSNVSFVLSISFYNRDCHLFQRHWYSACTKSTVFFRTITFMLYVQTFQFCVIEKRWRCAFRLRYLSYFSWHLLIGSWTFLKDTFSLKWGPLFPKYLYCTNPFYCVIITCNI